MFMYFLSHSVPIEMAVPLAITLAITRGFSPQPRARSSWVMQTCWQCLRRRDGREPTAVTALYPTTAEVSWWRVFFFLICFFWFCSPFLAICGILELKSVFCMHFGARISHLRAHLAFGFTWLHLASLGFTWLMAHGFWFWFHLVLVLAVHVTWLLAFVGWVLVF